MSNETDILFIGEKGGIDLDSDPRNAMGWRGLLNMYWGTTDSSHAGALEDKPGNKKTNYTLPAGQNKVIGCAEDQSSNLLYAFLWNENNNHQIFEYNPNTDTATKVVQFNFNWGENRYIINPRVIDGTTGKLLYWTDPIPRKINVNFAKAYTAAVDSGGTLTSGAIPYYDPAAAAADPTNKLRRYKGVIYKKLALSTAFLPTWQSYGAGYGIINDQTVDLIKYPPKQVPSYVYSTDTARQTNQLALKIFQFRYRYVYDDYDKSVLGFYSKVNPAQYAEYLTYSSSFEAGGSGFTTQPNSYFPAFINVNKNNKITITLNTGHATVRYIEVYYRVGNTGQLYKFKTIDKWNDLVIGGTVGDDQSFTIDFFGDEQVAAASDLTETQVQDLVPRNCNESEILDKNTLLLGDITEGFNNITPAVTLTPVYTLKQMTNSMEFGFVVLTDAATNLIKEVTPAGAAFTTVALPSAGDYIQIQSAYNYSKLVLIQAADVASNAAFQAFLLSLLSDVKTYVNSFGAITINFVSGGPATITVTTTNNFFLQLWFYSDVNKYMTFEAGADHKLGIVYYDRGLRRGAVNYNQGCKFFVPFLSVIQTTGFRQQSVSIEKQVTVGWQVNHLPLPNTTHWAWVYSKNTRATNFVQYRTRGIKVDSKFNIIKVKIDSLLSYAQKVGNPSFKISFNAGDRVWFPEYSFELEVTGFDATDQFILCKYDANVDINAFDITLGFAYIGAFIEVYTPKPQTDDAIFYEIGEVYEIGDVGLPTAYHKGPTTNQTVALNGTTGAYESTAPATGTLTGGDVWMKRRQIPVYNSTSGGTAPNFFPDTVLSDYRSSINDPNFSDWYDSNDTNSGNINRIDVNAQEQRFKALARFSNTIVPNTQINGLSTFESNNYKQYAVISGAITGMRSLGDVLKIIQEFGYTSTYVGKRRIFNADQSSEIIATDSLLAEDYVLNRSYGCQHPESISVFNNKVYFFDVNKGAWVKDAGNGLEEFSKYYVRNFWQDKAQLLRDNTSPLVKVFSRTDVHTGYLFTAIRNTALAAELQTVFAYNDTANRWMGFYSFENFDYLTCIGSEFITFKNGEIWRHYRGDDNSNFYGVQYNNKVKVSASVNPKKVVTWKALSYHSNGLFFGEEDSVTNDLTGFKSRIPAGKFAVKENAYYADLSRNTANPNYMSKSEAAVNAEEARAEYLEVELTNVPQDAQTVLYNVCLKSEDSPYSY